jgi:predicted TIM-barrel fold metal-dependent hydrolase
MSADALPLTEIPIVDAHHHFWDLQRNYYPWLCDPDPVPFRYGDYSAIRHDYLPTDLAQDSRGLHLTKTVHMEAEYDRVDSVAETRWLESVNRTSGYPSACVGHAELDRLDVEQVLSGHAASPLVRGIRHKPKSSSTPSEAKRGAAGSMDDPRWRAGYALLERFGFSYDLQTPWWHLDAAAELAADFPRTRIIINHTGLPADRSGEGLAGWRKALDLVAARPNIAIKISGLGQPRAPWTVEANKPVIRDTIKIFGVERCMFASNFPVDSLVATYREIFDGFFQSVADYSPSDRMKLFNENAVRIYRLT